MASPDLHDVVWKIISIHAFVCRQRPNLLEREEDSLQTIETHLDTIRKFEELDVL